MIVDIDKIVVKDRIRRDFGDIEELAEDIKLNGLINPPTVNKEYELLTGERRLRACRMLGWQQVEVRMMDTRDAEHELNIEISENDVRKGFSKAERVDYMRRLLRIEEAKAKERKDAALKQNRDSVRLNSDERSRADEVASKKFGVSRDTLRKEISIAEHKDSFDLEDFADWDEGRLSTNKAYQMLKKKLQEAERGEAESRAKAKSLQARVEALEAREPETKVPDDYASVKMAAARAEKDYLEAKQKSVEKDKKIRELESQLGRDKLLQDADRDVQMFTNYTFDYIRRYGGHVWAFEQLDNLSEPVRNDFIKAIKTLDAFAQQMIRNLEGGNALNE